MQRALPTPGGATAGDPQTTARPSTDEGCCIRKPETRHRPFNRRRSLQIEKQRRCAAATHCQVHATVGGPEGVQTSFPPSFTHSLPSSPPPRRTPRGPAAGSPWGREEGGGGRDTRPVGRSVGRQWPLFPPDPLRSAPHNDNVTGALVMSPTSQRTGYRPLLASNQSEQRRASNAGHRVL